MDRVNVGCIQSCVMAARPKTLPAAVVPVWVGAVLAYKLSGNWDLPLLAATLVGALAIQIATNFFNDAIDARKGADTERRLGPVRVTASGLLPPHWVMGLACGFLGIALACGVVLYQSCGWPIALIGVPSLFLAYGYTGGPVPLAYRGLGEAFVLIFFGWVAVAGTTFIQTLHWPIEAWLLGTQVGLLSAVLISINNLRDREEDATTAKRTLAVRWGVRAARITIAVEILLPGMLGLCWLWLGHPAWALAGVVSLVPGLWILWKVVTLPPGPQFNQLLALGGAQLLAFAVLFSLFAK
jgi:1,4-dihydroxy-2-naphthoate octaprenyltransferase